jgi:hypothetical protein
MSLRSGTLSSNRARHRALFTLSSLFLLASSSIHAQQATYSLKTVAWGYYDAKAAPVLRVKSGDTVEIQTLITNSPNRLEEAGLSPEQLEQSLCVALRFS